MSDQADQRPSRCRVVVQPYYYRDIITFIVDGNQPTLNTESSRCESCDVNDGTADAFCITMRQGGLCVCEPYGRVGGITVQNTNILTESGHRKQRTRVPLVPLQKALEPIGVNVEERWAKRFDIL